MLEMEKQEKAEKAKKRAERDQNKDTESGGGFKKDYNNRGDRDRGDGHHGNNRR